MFNKKAKDRVNLSLIPISWLIKGLIRYYTFFKSLNKIQMTIKTIVIKTVIIIRYEFMVEFTMNFRHLN